MYATYGDLLLFIIAWFISNLILMKGVDRRYDANLDRIRALKRRIGRIERDFYQENEK